MNVEVRRRRGFRNVNAGHVPGGMKRPDTDSRKVSYKFIDEDDMDLWRERTSPGAREPLQPFNFIPMGERFDD